MEIERKYLVTCLPDLSTATEVKSLVQGYISRSPVIRIRQSNSNYILTCKGKGLMAREEFELFIEKEEFMALKSKVDDHLITKKRYLIPYGNHTIELDVFQGILDGLIMAEVEFNSIEEANRFRGPDWFGADVTMDSRYQNNHLATLDSLGSLNMLK